MYAAPAPSERLQWRSSRHCTNCFFNRIHMGLWTLALRFSWMHKNTLDPSDKAPGCQIGAPSARHRCHSIQSKAALGHRLHYSLARLQRHFGLALKWGHPSDNLGAFGCGWSIYLKSDFQGEQPLMMREVLKPWSWTWNPSVICTWKLVNQGWLLPRISRLRVAFNCGGVTKMMGGTESKSGGCISGLDRWFALRTYSSCTERGARVNSWAAGDAHPFPKKRKKKAGVFPGF